jgi:predicted signal transduction protein with EAL and GGDEF domain
MLSVQVAESFRARLADYIFKHSGEQIDIGCSIGVTGISPGTTSAAEVLSQADLACHLAKRGGRNRVHLYNTDDAESAAAMAIDMGWSRRIKEAIEKDRFVLACQPSSIPPRVKLNPTRC